MRIHDGDFAYDLEKVRDPLTQLVKNWKFTVFKLRPVETVVDSGDASTRAEAEKKAQRAVSRLQAKERRQAA